MRNVIKTQKKIIFRNIQLNNSIFNDNVSPTILIKCLIILSDLSCSSTVSTRYTLKNKKTAPDQINIFCQTSVS